MRKYSVIIPVYNRPDEIGELLDSLLQQEAKPFEVLVVEDGSALPCEDIVLSYKETLPVTYLNKQNTGQGFSRNYGFERANGDYFVVFDSDCILPPDYFIQVDKALDEKKLDAFGGPDRSRGDFTAIQKAINYSMTSPLTTGGIRGNNKHMGSYYPRSFNMGISREVFDKTKGYKITRMGEDIEFSIRVVEAGFKTGLIEKAFVFHRRRTSFWEFSKQLRFFGRARINVSRFYPKEIKLVHWLPLLFLLFQVLWIVSSIQVGAPWQLIGLMANGLFSMVILIHATFSTKDLWVGFLSIFTAYIQLLAYGSGLLTEKIVKTFKG